MADTADKITDACARLERIKRDFQQLQTEVSTGPGPARDEPGILARVGEKIARAEMQVHLAQRRLENWDARQNDRVSLRDRLDALVARVGALTQPGGG